MDLVADLGPLTNRIDPMSHLKLVESPPNMLAGHKGKTVDVICEDCELLRLLDHKTLLAEYGNIAMPSLLSLVAKSLGCTRTENSFSNRCRLHYHFSPEEWAKRRGFIDPNERTDQAILFADLREWHRLYAQCTCGRKSEVQRGRLEKALGERAPIADAGSLLKCRKCGVKGQAKIVVVSLARG